jgi:hypothetical protein
MIYTNQYFIKHFQQEKISQATMKNKNWKLNHFFAVTIFGKYIPTLYLFSTVFHQSKNFFFSLSSHEGTIPGGKKLLSSDFVHKWGMHREKA